MTAMAFLLFGVLALEDSALIPNKVIVQHASRDSFARDINLIHGARFSELYRNC